MSNKPLSHRQDSPDWRDPSCYEYTAELTFPQWAWEFLRRNPKYRQDWDRWGLENDVSAQTLDRLLSGETPQIAPTTKAFEQAAIDAAKWGLNQPLNPSMVPRAGEPFPVWRKELLGQRTYLLNRQHAAETIAKAPDEVIYIGLDLRLRLTPQIGFLKQVFKNERKDETRKLRGLSPVPPYPKVTKNQKDKFPAYIRTLDSDSIGVPFEEVAQVLWASYGNANKQHRVRLRKAMELRDCSYRDLLRLSDKDSIPTF